MTRIPLGIIGLTAFTAACTLQKAEVPPLVGPSESATSVQVAASPDLLPTDGQSTALVTVSVIDALGRPVRGLSLRAETRLNGSAVSLGVLSARSLVTDASGRAALTYAAPLINGQNDTGTIVDIVVIPIGSNFVNAAPRSVSIRLVPASP